jgi:hypothetical protein
LQNGTKHHANFLAKRYPFSILDFSLKRQKKNKKAKKPSHPMKNLAFWIELNTPMRNAFHHLKVVCIFHFVFHGELNTA